MTTTTLALMMNSEGERLSSVAQSHMAMHQKTAERNATVVHAFCLLASIMFCYRACTLCSLLRTLSFPGPYFWGWLVNLCLKSRGTLFFALCSANSRKLLTRALCPGFKACNAPADFANCHCVPANLLSRSLHPCEVFLDPNLSRQHVYSTVQNHNAQCCNQRQLHSAAIGLLSHHELESSNIIIIIIIYYYCCCCCCCCYYHYCHYHCCCCCYYYYYSSHPQPLSPI